MNFKNGPIQQIFNSKGEIPVNYFNKWEQMEDYSIRVDNTSRYGTVEGHVIWNTCEASNNNAEAVERYLLTCNRCTVQSRLGWNLVMRV